MKKNSEVRIQESESRRSLRDAKSERRLANASLRDAKGERYQSGIQTRDFIVDHQIFNLVGVQKRRLFRRSSTR
ncbi:hypothetical protein [Nostoc sp.]|uniref:hypothetical protein n=1 Tax=Nostoc sp. TaxID=1180 RepID=UPI002FF827AE